MTINDQIKDEKLQYDINREAVKISALSSGKLHKYECLTGEDILPSNQQQIIEQAKFTYSPLGKAFEKQIKTIEDQGKKQVDALKAIESGSSNKSTLTKEIYDDILEERMDEILKMSSEIDYKNLFYGFKGPTSPTRFSKFAGPMYTYDQLKNGETTLQQVEKQQKDFKRELNEITSGNPNHKSDNQLYVIKNVKNLYDSRQKIINLLNDNKKIRSKAIYKSKQNETRGKELKILTPKQMLQRLPIALAQVKAGNNSESLLNEIGQIVYSLYEAKEITKKVCSNLMNSLQKMDTIFKKSENSKTSKPHILKLELTNKIDLRLDKKVIALSNLSIYYTWNNIKSSHNNNKFKISASTSNEEFELPDGSYSVSDIQDYLEYIMKKHGEDIDKPSVHIYVNKIENRITFKIKKGCSLELSTKETMKLLGSTENKITKDKNGENVLHIEITEVVLVHCNMVNNDYQQDSRVLYSFVPNKPFGSLLEVSPANHIFLKTFNSEYDEIIVWFTDQNSKPLEAEDLTMVIK